MDLNSSGCVVAYHARIYVARGSEQLVLEVGVPDYATDAEILGELAKAVLAVTVGEVVEAVQRKEFKCASIGSGVVEALVLQERGARVWGWDERVNIM